MGVPVVLGLDVGTTSVRAVAFDAGGRVHGAGSRGLTLHEPAPGRVELDPGAVVDGALAALRDAAGAAHARDAEVAGVAVGTAMHALCALGADGRPLTGLLTWADLRASDEAEELRRAHPELQGRTGTPPHPMAPIAKLRWFAANAPDVTARARRWGGVKELVLQRLTGRFAVDRSVASGTGLLDLGSGDWDGEALRFARVGPDQLAHLVATAERLELTAAAARATGLPAALPVVAGAGDGPLASLGVGAVRPGVAACSIGTSGALRLSVERPATDPGGRLFCFGLVPGLWIVGGAVNNGGSVLQWLAGTLAPDLGAQDAVARLLDEAAAVPPGSDALLMLPSLLSERAPAWSVLPRGAYVGLTQAHRRGHLARAALEGVCLQLALVLDSMREAGHEVREVRATGGFARSPLWRQLLADALGLPIGFPSTHEGSAFGAALLGLSALGLLDGLERAAGLVPIDAVVQPDAAASQLYAELRPAFAGLDDALGPAFAALRRVRDAPQPGR